MKKRTVINAAIGFGLVILSITFSYSQSPLRQRIDFKAENERLEDVILSLAHAGQFSFSYNPSMLPIDSLITINVRDTPIRNLLSSMLGDEMEIRQQGNHLVILRTKFTEIPSAPSDPDKSTITISGFIRDNSTGQPIPKAVVFDINSLQSAVTNSDGYYTLDIPARHSVIGLSVLSRGVVDTTLVMENAERELNISLKPTSRKNGALSGSGADLIHQRSIVKMVAPEKSILRSTGNDLLTHRTFQVSFIPSAGTNLKMSGMVANKYSLNILAGYNGAVDRLEFGGLVNINRFYVHGVQIGGLANAVGEDTKGVQFAGIFNTNLGSVNGVQFAGVTNLVLDSMKGAQMAGVVNLTKGPTSGIQVAGVSNVAFREVDGFQVAGVGNFATRDVNKAQIAGVLNFGKDIPGGQFAGVLNTSYGNVGGIQMAGVLNSGRTVRSLQLAGVMNIAIDSVYGTQMAGVFNFTRKNHGFQLGLINVGDSAAGLSVGLLSLYLKGYHKVELSYNETLNWSVRVKLGANRKFYNIIGLGTQDFSEGEIWGYTYGVGTAIPLGQRKRNSLTIDLTATDLQDNDTWYEEWTVMGRLGMYYGQSIGKRFTIYAGPVFSNLFYDPDKVEDYPFILTIPPSNTLYHEQQSGIGMIGWVGFEVGLRLL